MTPATLLTFDGIEQPITEWAHDYGILPEIIIARLDRGDSIEAAITRPMIVAPGQKLPMGFAEAIANTAPTINVRTFTHDGKTLTVKQWAELTGIRRATLDYRLRQGLSLAEAIANSDRRLKHGKDSPFGFANLGRTLPT